MEQTCTKPGRRAYIQWGPCLSALPPKAGWGVSMGLGGMEGIGKVSLCKARLWQDFPKRCIAHLPFFGMM